MDHVTDIAAAEAALTTVDNSCVIPALALDLDLAEGSGLAVLRDARSRGNSTPGDNRLRY